MSDIPRTLQEQPGSPDAQASGDASRPSSETGSDQRPTAPADARPAKGSDEDAAEVQGDLAELVKTAAERDEYLALAQRTQADFENYRKRVARESSAAGERGMAALAKELLPVLDNLDRALADAGKAAGEAGEDDPLLAGVRLVRSELSA